MGYKNPKELLIAGARYPAAIEKALPEGAPEISTMLVDAANRVPDFPDFLVELPDLPEPPELPKPGEGFPGLGRYVSAVEVTPVTARRPVSETSPTPVGRYEATPAIGRGVLPEVVTRRGM